MKTEEITKWTAELEHLLAEVRKVDASLNSDVTVYEKAEEFCERFHEDFENALREMDGAGEAVWERLMQCQRYWQSGEMAIALVEAAAVITEVSKAAPKVAT